MHSGPVCIGDPHTGDGMGKSSDVLSHADIALPVWRY